jgi:RNA polymerase sigma-70 factor, ECF subfamily
VGELVARPRNGRRFGQSTVEGCRPTRSVPTRANGQPALAYYHLDAGTGRHVATALDVFTCEGVLIKEITAFITPDVFARFGLARVLDA